MSKTLKNLYNNQYAFSIIAKGTGVLIGFLYSIAFSRYFGANLRGEFAIITNYIGILYIFLCMGMYQAYPFYRTGLREEDLREYYLNYINDTFGLFLLYSLISVGLFFALKLDRNLAVVLLFLPSEFLVKQLNYVVLIENPKLRNLTGIKFNAFELIFTLFLSFVIAPNYSVCILFIVVKQLVNCVFAVSNLRIRFADIRPRLSANILKFMKFGFVPMLSTLLMTVNYKIDILMLDFFDNVTVGEVGIYSLGVSLAERVWLIPDALKDILLSKLSKGKTYWEVAKVIRISLPIMLLFAVALFVLGQPFIVFVYGAEFAGAYKITMQIVLGVVFMVFYKMINSYYIVKGLKVRSFVMLLISSVVNVALNALLIPVYGISGAAIASLVSYALCSGMFVVTFLRITKLPVTSVLFIKKADILAIKQRF